MRLVSIKLTIKNKKKLWNSSSKERSYYTDKSLLAKILISERKILISEWISK